MVSLQKRNMTASRVTEIENGWRLCMDPGPARKYRWAQIDDYTHLPRKDFPWRTPLTMEVRARISQPDAAGTWGFGYWNDPFSFAMGPGDTSRKLPVLPNAAWFFYASPPNYLSIRDDRPAQGFLAATFRSPLLPPPLLALGLPAAPLLLLPASARLLRRLARLFVRESSVHVPTPDLTSWHTYRLELLPDAARFYVDRELIAETRVIPRGRLGFVLWVDNQFAAFKPDGRLGYGTLANEKEVCLNVCDINLHQSY